MSVAAYYSMMSKGSSLNANYLAYKSRVQADGGAVVDETVTNNVFEFLDNNSLRTDLKFAISKDAGNLITSSAIEKAYTLYQGVIGANLDFEQDTSLDRPSEDYDFDGVNSFLGSVSRINTVDSQNEFSFFFKTGTLGSITGGLRRILISMTQGVQFTGFYINSSGNLGTTIINSATSFQDRVFSTVIADNKSYMITCDVSKNIKLFVDGVLVETLTTTLTPAFRRSFWVGAFSGGFIQFFDGQLTDLYLFNSDQSSNASIIHSNL